MHWTVVKLNSHIMCWFLDFVLVLMLWRHFFELICLLNVHYSFMRMIIPIFMCGLDLFNFLWWFRFSYGGNLPKNFILKYVDLLNDNFIDDLVKLDLIFYLCLILFLASCFWEFWFVKKARISHIADCFNEIESTFLQFENVFLLFFWKFRQILFDKLFMQVFVLFLIILIGLDFFLDHLRQILRMQMESFWLDRTVTRIFLELPIK
jgi:hypothetical protein